jgi:hypothetical protein
MSDIEPVPVEETQRPPAIAVASPAPAPLPLAHAPMTLQNRADRIMVRAIPELRYRIARFGVVGVAGALSLLAAVVLAIAVLLPARQSVLNLTGQLSQVSKFNPVPATHTLTPHQFAGTLPTRGQIPALLGTVLAQANDAGVVLEQGKYTYTPPAGNRLARYAFEFPIKADYASIRSFINKSLAAVPALGLDKLRIERKNVGDPTVNAEVGFVIYMRGA